MDIDIGRWILEFVLRSPIEDRYLKKLLTALPFSDDDLRLKKTVLLRTIEMEISDASVTERILEILEMIEELDKREGIMIMESMKNAYCAVAVESTVKYLVVGIDKNEKYFYMVKKIWRGRVREMEDSVMSELVSPELIEWRNEVEAALWDASVVKKLTNMNTRNEALRSVKKYLGEAWAVVGPSFLQLAARLSDRKVINDMQIGKSNGNSETMEVGEEVASGTNVSRDVSCEDIQMSPLQVTNQEEADSACNEWVSGKIGMRKVSSATANQNERKEELAALQSNQSEVQELFNNQVAVQAGERAVTFPDASPIPVPVDLDVPVSKRKENLGSSVLRKRKLPAFHRHTRGVTISDSEDLRNDASSSKHNNLLTPEVNKVQEALKSSLSELQAVVNDPLPDALRLSEAIISEMLEKNANHNPCLMNHNAKDVDKSSSSIGKTIETVPTENAQTGNQWTSLQNNVPRQSLMESNNTAHTYEWNDSIDNSWNSSEGRVIHTGRPHLPSPKRRAVSPLRKYELTKFSRRRMIKKWSLIEENTLRDAVRRYGKGNWKLILNFYRDVFVDRTMGDLKDKWRNMTK